MQHGVLPIKNFTSIFLNLLSQITRRQSQSAAPSSFSLLITHRRQKRLLCHGKQTEPIVGRWDAHADLSHNSICLLQNSLFIVTRVEFSCGHYIWIKILSTLNLCHGAHWQFVCSAVENIHPLSRDSSARGVERWWNWKEHAETLVPPRGWSAAFFKQRREWKHAALLAVYKRTFLWHIPPVRVALGGVLKYYICTLENERNLFLSEPTSVIICLRINLMGCLLNLISVGISLIYLVGRRDE